jgi:cholesterol transport system auxiliary component
MAVKAVLAASAVLALAGCSLGGKAPKELYTLTPLRSAPAGATASGTATTALAVLEPGTPQRLGYTRIPVQVNPTTVEYIKDATWTEKPARLFQRLVSETIRAKGTRLVVGENDLQYAASTKLTGQLIDFGYDAASGSAVVRYDAVLQTGSQQQVRTRRFEATVAGVAATGPAVSAALNQAANQVAGEVADWVG